jgi:hypothetical protein
LKETEPYTNQQAKTTIMKRSKPRQAHAQSKDSPNRWRCPPEGGIRPCFMGQRLAAITVRATAVRMFAVISPTSHHRQWAGHASRSVVTKGNFSPNPLKIKRAR